jgi:hypothetical protein
VAAVLAFRALSITLHHRAGRHAGNEGQGLKCTTKVEAARQVMMHLIPALDSSSHGPFVIPGGPLGLDDFVVPAREGGFQGEIYVGRDLMSIRLQQ